MGKIEMRPRFILGALVVLGLLVNLAILATGARGGGETETVPTIDRRVQERTLRNLKTEIATSEAEFRTSLEPQKDTIKRLFSLAQQHAVIIEKLENTPPEPGNLGSTSFDKLVTQVEIRGNRDDIIAMLLELGGTAVISNVGVSGTTEDWRIQFVFTQYLRST